MKIKITKAIQEELRETISDAFGHKQNGMLDPSDPIYIKIGNAQGFGSGKTITVDADETDAAELKSRAMYEAGPDGVCNENISWSSDFYDRAYWLGRKRAYTALLKQLSN